MNLLLSFVHKDERRFCLCAAAVLCFLYFLFLFRFYLIEYYVPDFSLYGYMAASNRKSADGFSSLFIWVAGISRFMPNLVVFTCLFMLATSLFNILSFYIRCFYINVTRFVFYTVALFSTGTWYYFYGKVFYDFPFSAFTYSLCLWQMGKVILRWRQQKPFDKNWFYFFAFSGLALSWKPYNIFMLAGLLLCSLANDEIRNIVLSKAKSARMCALSFTFLAIGYVIGNFNFLVSPKETIKGIIAYKASFPFKEFLYGKAGVIWDHVNNLPFCVSIFSLTAMFLLFMVVPLISKRKRYAAVFAVMFLFFRVYIKYCSPGYTWHGLPFGIFLVTLLMFLLSEKRKFPRGAKSLLLFAVGIQLSITFGLYVPTQIKWHSATQKSIAVLENHNGEILGTVQDIVKEFDGKPFYIYQPVQRQKPMCMSPLRFRPIGLKQPYIIFDDIRDYSPLESQNFYDWEKLYKMENSVQYKTNKWTFRNCAKYLIYIVPNDFKSLVDVADVWPFEDLVLYKRVLGDGYTIYIYDTKL